MRESACPLTEREVLAMFPRRWELVAATCMFGIFTLAGCASSRVTFAPADATSTAQVSPTADSSPVRGCVDLNPVAPSPVSPAVPGVDAAGDLAATWTLDGGQLSITPAVGTKPGVSRRQALCTLLAALEVNHGDVAQDTVTGGDSGLSLVLGRVSIADTLINAPDDNGVIAEGAEPAPALTPFHDRLAWVAIINPPLITSCPAQLLPASPAASPAESAGASAQLSTDYATDRLVPYQLLVLDAATGTDGVLYQAHTNQPCQPDQLTGPEVGPLMVNVSVPWRLVSRDPGGLFATISVSVTTCDSYVIGANTAPGPTGHPGLVTLTVARPLAPCGKAKQQQQILRGPTVSDPLPATLLHATTGLLDVTPDQSPAAESVAPAEGVVPAALLCEEGTQSTGPVAAAQPTTVAQLRSIHDRSGTSSFTRQLVTFPATAAAAWCENKTSSGYTITAVDPNHNVLTGHTITSSTYLSLTSSQPPY